MKLVIWIIIICILAFITGFFVGKHVLQDQEGYRDISELFGLASDLVQIESETWNLGAMTIVTPYIYKNAVGEDITYYACQTAYGSIKPQRIDGIHMSAVGCVIDPVTAESSRACKVNQQQAIIYSKQGLDYLCWTLTPEISCVLVYDPNAVALSDIIKMAESVPAE